MKISFIGAGNATTSMIRGIMESCKSAKTDICVADIDQSKLDAFVEYNQELKTFFGTEIITTDDNQFAVNFADCVFLAIRPQHHEAVLSELKNTKGKIFVTMAPGITIDYVSGKLNGAKVIRTMPNTPAMVGEGVTAVARGNGVSEKEFAAVTKLLSSFSTVHEFSESQMNDIVALSGSSPAYVYLLIEAMCDFCASKGIDKKIAAKMATETVLGAAFLLQSSDKSPAELRNNVCTEGGTTIRAIEKMEALGFTTAIKQGMEACTKRAKELEDEFSGR
jgi:pyrroline-5-carboxylate reductase